MGGVALPGHKPGLNQPRLGRLGEGVRLFITDDVSRCITRLMHGKSAVVVAVVMVVVFVVVLLHLTTILIKLLS